MLTGPPPKFHGTWDILGLSDSLLTYTGPVIFDRIGLSWASRITYFAI
jgi:hypothetical protein